MDAKVLAWAGRVKPGADRPAVPRLWLFTDMRRLPDPLPVLALLPRRRAGVVLRPEGMPPGLPEAIAAICRRRRLMLSVAGDARLARRLRGGFHLRGGRRPGAPVPHATGSAHDAREVRRCRRAGVQVTFISPVFATPSHPDGRALGVMRWAALARLAGRSAAALGGIDAASVRRLPPCCAAIGAIGAWRPVRVP